jgi:hypothetical protein
MIKMQNSSSKIVMDEARPAHECRRGGLNGTPAEILLDGLESFIFLNRDIPRIQRTETS